MNKCKHIDCKEYPLSLSEFCWKHIEDKKKYRQVLTDYISTSNSIKGFYLRRLEFPDAQWQGIDAEETDLAAADLSGANLTTANLKKTNLTGANLKEADLASVDLEEAHLLRCNLSGARLWNAVIKGSNLAEANLQEADFLKAVFSDVKFWHTKLNNAKFITRHNFIGKSPINEKGLLSASEAYRNLKQYFITNGRYDDSSWACFKERQLERKYLFKTKKLLYFPSLIMALLCGYGEKPCRVILSSTALIFIYSIIYAALDILKASSEVVNANGFSIWDYIYFSIVTFTTVGFGDLSPKMVPLFQMLVGSEAFVGAFMIGLFVFTLARKYTAR